MEISKVMKNYMTVTNRESVVYILKIIFYVLWIDCFFKKNIVQKFSRSFCSYKKLFLYYHVLRIDHFWWKIFVQKFSGNFVPMKHYFVILCVLNQSFLKNIFLNDLLNRIEKLENASLSKHIFKKYKKLMEFLKYYKTFLNFWKYTKHGKRVHTQ